MQRALLPMSALPSRFLFSFGKPLDCYAVRDAYYTGNGDDDQKNHYKGEHCVAESRKGQRTKLTLKTKSFRVRFTD